MTAAAPRAAPESSVTTAPEAAWPGPVRHLPDGDALVTLRLAGLHCAACGDLIEHALTQQAGVRQAQVSVAAERASVRWDPAQSSPADLVAAVRRAGYDASPDEPESARALRQREARQALWRLFVAGFCSMQVMMLATPAYVSTGNELAPDLRQLLNWGSWLVSLPVMVFSAAPFFRGAWGSIRMRRIGMDVPVALGLAVTFLVSSAATFDPTGPFGHEVWFDSLTMFVSFLLLARWAEAKARHRVALALEQATNAMPATARRVGADGRDQTVPLTALIVGDRLKVALGEPFPCDGRLETGPTAADEQMLTGESHPVPKAVGDAVTGGSVNVGAPVQMVAERVGDDTRMAAIGQLVRQAASERPALGALADRWAAPFLAVVLLLAFGAGLVWWFIDPSRAAWVVVAVLIVTCPCALSLAAPAAMLAAAGTLARRGVLVRRLDALATMASVDRVMLDKTGTLTEQGLRWQGVQRSTHSMESPESSVSSVLPPVADAAAWALAGWSRHPVSQALRAGLETDAGRADEATALGLTDVREHPGQGIEAVDGQGRRWRLGSRAFASAPAVAASTGPLPPIPAAGDAAHQPSPADSALQAWLSVDGQLLACHRVDEQLRADAGQAIAALRQDGIGLALLSGDAPERAQAIGTTLGLADVYGGLQPQDKLALLEQAQRAGHRVAMVGDGLNDGPVLARADVSIAMGLGALGAEAPVDAVIGSGRLADVVVMRRLSRRLLRVVRQNFAWAGLYNLVSIPLAVIGWVPPLVAGLGMAASSLLVVLNALRLGRE